MGFTEAVAEVRIPIDDQGGFTMNWHPEQAANQPHRRVGVENSIRSTVTALGTAANNIAFSLGRRISRKV